MARSDWDTYFMEIARVVATRATCDRKHVGAVLVRDRTILSTGYLSAESVFCTPEHFSRPTDANQEKSGLTSR